MLVILGNAAIFKVNLSDFPEMLSFSSGLAVILWSSYFCG